MEANNQQHIEQRLASLERSNRRYRFSLLALVLVLGGLGLVAGRQGVSDLVQTKRLEILDDNGNVVMVSEANKDGGGRVSVQNGSGIRVANIECNKDGNGEIFVNDSRGVKSFDLRSTADGGRAGMYNFGGSPMVEMTIEQNNGAILAYSPEGDVVGKLGGEKVVKKRK